MRLLLSVTGPVQMCTPFVSRIRNLRASDAQRCRCALSFPCGFVRVGAISPPLRAPPRAKVAFELLKEQKDGSFRVIGRREAYRSKPSRKVDPCSRRRPEPFPSLVEPRWLHACITSTAQLELRVYLTAWHSKAIAVVAQRTIATGSQYVCACTRAPLF